MIETLSFILALLAGILLGAFFFGGLWWTIQRSISSRFAALWFLGSLLLRTAVALTGFYFVSYGDWRRLLLCLLGFVAARFFVMRLTSFPAKRPTRIIERGAA